MNARDVAYTAVCLGFSVVPPREDGTKAPLGTWKRFMSRLPSMEEMDTWYGTGEGPLRSGVGLIMGNVSGGAECLEFDAGGRCYEPFKERARALGLGGLVDRLDAGYLERSPSGGVHWLYRCPGVAEGNTKLAMYPSDEINPKTGEPTPKALIETRGEGGYVVIAPSNGKVHPTGKPYVLLAGGLESIPVVTPQERAALFEVARTFDELPPPEPKPKDKARKAGGGTTTAEAGEVTPWDDYNAKTTWGDLLAGWTKVYEKDGVTYWRRPGKDIGVSASTGRDPKHDRLWCWSTSTDFQAGLVGDKADVYAALHHGGDFKKAVAALRLAGFGTARREEEHDAASDLDTKLARKFRTELGNSERLIARYRSRLWHVEKWAKWLVWDGTRWALDTKDARVLRLAKNTARRIIREAATFAEKGDQKAHFQWAIKSQKRSVIAASIFLARSDVLIQHEELDRQPYLFNCPNGTIDLRTGKLLAHDPRHLITQLCPTPYDPDATCPRFLKFLDEIFAGKHRAELVAFMKRWFGYCLTGVCSEQKMPFWFGEGNNGKSTLLLLMHAVFGGDYAMEASRDLLIAKKHPDHLTTLADLFGKRLVTIVETTDEHLDVQQFKHLTGGDIIRARRMREDTWEFKPTHKLTMATNERPSITGGGLAEWRRILSIPFEVIIPPERIDPKLGAKLLKEAPGILAWCVRGCLDWQEAGLSPPPVVLASTKAYRESQDNIDQFLAEECVRREPKTASLKIKTTKLRNTYSTWCDKFGHIPVKPRQFDAAMLKRGYEPKHNNGMWFYGIDLRSDNPDLAAEDDKNV